MSRSGSEMAGYIIDYCNKNNFPISNLKLQKVLYYVQAAFLVEGNEAFSDDIMAWKYGPVVRAVYHQYKIYVNQNIDTPVEKSDLQSSQAKIVNHVVDSYKNYTALEMVAKTHKEKPWIEANGKERPVIEKAKIKYFYGEDGEGRNLIYGEK